MKHNILLVEDEVNTLKVLTTALKKEKFQGKPSAYVQHELDHLNGILFTDYLSPIRSRLLANKLNSLESVGLV